MNTNESDRECPRAEQTTAKDSSPQVAELPEQFQKLVWAESGLTLRSDEDGQYPASFGGG